MSRALALPICCALMALPVGAAATGDERVRLSYSAPASCPNRRAFEDMVRGRTRLARIVSEGEDVRAFDVHVELVRSRPVGTLRVRERDGRPSDRSLDAETCAEVVDGLALIIALAIDPNASVRAGPVEAPVVVPPPMQPVPSAKPAPRREPGVAWLMGALAIVHGGASPNAMPGASAFVEARWGRGWLTLATRVSLSAGIDSDASTGRAASFRWTAGALELMPGRLRAGPLEGSPWLWLEAGATRVSGSTASPVGIGPWISLGFGGRVRLWLGQRLFLELSGGLHFPQIRYHVTFEQGAVKELDVPVVSFAGAFGLGAQFP